MTSDTRNDKDLEPLWRLRQSIDNIDAAMIFMLAERFKYTNEIGKFKAAHELPPTDKKRETQQEERLRALAQNAQINPDFVNRLFRLIIDEVVHNHKNIKNAIDLNLFSNKR